MAVGTKGGVSEAEMDEHGGGEVTEAATAPQTYTVKPIINKGTPPAEVTREECADEHTRKHADLDFKHARQRYNRAVVKDHVANNPHLEKYFRESETGSELLR